MQNNHHYAILKKNEEYLAIYTNPNTQYELDHYFDQDYVFIMDLWASNAKNAIQRAKNCEKSEIAKLNLEINTLRHENARLKNENINLRNSGHNLFFTQSNHNPLDILGFKNKPTEDELKKRFKQLSQKFHPDKEGSNYLMSLINGAYNQLKNGA